MFRFERAGLDRQRLCLLRWRRLKEVERICLNTGNTIGPNDSDASVPRTEYTFSDTSGDRSRVCFNDDLPGIRDVSIHLLLRPGGAVTEITDSEASGRERKLGRCNVSRDRAALIFESDNNTLVPDGTEDNQDHIF